MSALIVKSANRLFNIFKVYLGLALFGALAVTLIELIIAKPSAFLVGFIVISFLFMGILLWYQTDKLTLKLVVEREIRKIRKREPPRLAESLITLVLPVRLRDEILADLRHEFNHLLRFGRRSAEAWYFVTAARIVLKITLLSITLRTSEVFIKEIVNRESRLR